MPRSDLLRARRASAQACVVARGRGSLSGGRPRASQSVAMAQCPRAPGPCWAVVGVGPGLPAPGAGPARAAVPVGVELRRRGADAGRGRPGGGRPEGVGARLSQAAAPWAAAVRCVVVPSLPPALLAAPRRLVVGPPSPLSLLVVVESSSSLVRRKALRGTFDLGAAVAAPASYCRRPRSVYRRGSPVGSAAGRRRPPSSSAPVSGCCAQSKADRKSTRLNSSHAGLSRMPSSA